jgi:hypothetical protein
MTSASRGAVRASLPCEAEGDLPKPAANGSTTLLDARRPPDTDAPSRCGGAHSVFVQFAKCPISPCAIRSIKAVRVAGYIQFRQRESARPAAEAPVYASMSGNRLHPPLIREMFRKPVFSLGQAGQARIPPPPPYGLGRSFRLLTPLPWCRESVNPGGAFVHPSAFLGYVEPASGVLCLAITGDRPRGGLPTPLSMGRVP